MDDMLVNIIFYVGTIESVHNFIYFIIPVHTYVLNVIDI